MHGKLKEEMMFFNFFPGRGILQVFVYDWRQSVLSSLRFAWLPLITRPDRVKTHDKPILGRDGGEIGHSSNILYENITGMKVNTAWLCITC